MTIEYIIPKKKTDIHNFIKKYKNKTFLLKNDSINHYIETGERPEKYKRDYKFQ
jgi:hypothetical protein